MHMADALISTPVALGAAALSIALIAAAGKEIKKTKRENLVPLMGVLGAFVFAAQMINFSIPGTGSSGHLIGGVLLGAMLGPWAAFLTLVSVLIIQCLVFADGGLLALGCNIINMAACTCLIAYPLVFRPLIGKSAPAWRVFAVSVLACVVGLEAGAVAVTCETQLSGVTALPFSRFMTLMGLIHLAIGIGEGLATATVLLFVMKTRPGILYENETGSTQAGKRTGTKGAVIAFTLAALLTGGVLAVWASEKPDGLEWSIEKVTGSTDLDRDASPLAPQAGGILRRTALFPDYDSRLSGIVGTLLTLAVVWSIGSLAVARRKRKTGGPAR